MSSLKSRAEAIHFERVAAIGCVICRRLYGHYVPAQIHHVAEHSSKRSNYAVVGLCEEHHTGGAGFHHMGTKAFCRLYRVPGETEWGLLAWVNQDIAESKP